jgi:hypothetical protein
MPHFIDSCGEGFCDLGMEEEEEMKYSEFGTELKSAPAGRYLLMK